MARRGSNLFRQRDGVRALKIARDGGIVPAMIEIVCQDGTIFRVYGDKAKGGVERNPWDEVLGGDGKHGPKSKRSS